MKRENRINTIDDYIATFPKEVQSALVALRQTIKDAAPLAQETISYGIPTFKLSGNLVHFAAYKSHIGFYPTPSGIEAFREELSPYEVSKGTVKFPLDRPLPLGLVSRMVVYRVEEQSKKKSK